MSWRQFHQLLTAVRSHWFAVVLCTLLGGLGASMLSIALPVSFHSTARVFIASPDWNDNTASATPDGKGRVVTYAFGDQFTQLRAVSYKAMINSELVAAAVIDQLKLNTTPSELAGRISSRVVPDTVMVDVTVRDSTAQGAADIANATANQVIALIKRLETPSKLVESPVQPVLLEPAKPPQAPSSPRVVMYLFGGLVIGLLLGVTYAAARQRIKSDEIPAELLIDDRTLGVLRSRKVPQFVVLEDIEGELVEDVRYLCLRLDAASVGTANDTGRTILLTSPRACDEVGAAAVLVAAGFAELGRRVAVVLTNFAGADSDSSGAPGLGEVLDGEANLGRVLRYDEAGEVAVVSAGETKAPRRVLAGEEMDAVLQQLSVAFDFVLVVGGPVLESTESLELAGKLGGALLVCPVPPSTGAEVVESERLLGLAPTASLGRVVVTDPSGRNDTAAGARTGGARSKRRVNSES